MNAAISTTPTPRTAESTMSDLITYDLYIDGNYSGGNSLLGHPRFLA